MYFKENTSLSRLEQESNCPKRIENQCMVFKDKEISWKFKLEQIDLMGKWITLIFLIKEQAQNIQSGTNIHQNT